MTLGWLICIHMTARLACPLPRLTLWQLGLTSVCSTDSWIENDSLSVDKHLDDQLDCSSLRSRGSTHSTSSSEHKGLPMPRLQALPAGQVFNSSTGMQILVIPSQDDHVLEVSVT